VYLYIGIIWIDLLVIKYVEKFRELGWSAVLDGDGIFGRTSASFIGANRGGELLSEFCRVAREKIGVDAELDIVHL